MHENVKEIVNGKLLPQYSGKKVIVVGKVVQVNPNGLSFQLQTVDDVKVKVDLKRPNRDVLEDFVEVKPRNLSTALNLMGRFILQVHGMSQGHSIICDEVILFPSETTCKFDSASYNVLCNLLHSIPDLWKTKIWSS